jgi:hypothetical protein
MKVSKFKVVLVAAFSASMCCSLCLAGEMSPDAEEMMTEGIAYPSVEQKIVMVKVDSATPSAEEMMADGIPHPSSNPMIKTVADTKIPSSQEMMAEGICLEAKSPAPVLITGLPEITTAKTKSIL